MVEIIEEKTLMRPKSASRLGPSIVGQPIRPKPMVASPLGLAPWMTDLLGLTHDQPTHWPNCTYFLGIYFSNEVLLSMMILVMAF